MTVKLISVTEDAEKLMAYCARVSNPNNQQNENYTKLLKYCVDHQHWSIFEHGFMTLEINTTRGIAAQILRHRSFTFQEFSQRYSEANLLGEIETPEIRRQDTKNRQNSINDIEDWKQNYWKNILREHFDKSLSLYESMINDGVAKECARFVLPLATPTRLYMSGTCRSWIHYIELRSANGTQKEHMNIANECKNIFKEQFPSVSDALGWNDD